MSCINCIFYELVYLIFQLFAVTMVTLVVAEAPLPYNYNRPSSGAGPSSFGSSGFGSSGFGGSQGSFGGGSSFGGSGFGASNEGANVDAQLLEQVRQILLREESQASASAPSSSYGAPSSQYGAPPAQIARVVGIQLENTIPAIQVAAFSQQSYAPAPQAGGYSYSPAPGIITPNIN